MSDVDATLPEVVVTAKREPEPPPAAKEPSGNKLWIRNWSLTVGMAEAPEEKASAAIDVGHDEDSKTQGGKSISLTDFRIVFSVEKIFNTFPWKLTATVYNVPQWLVKKITAQYTEVTLVAGYQIKAPQGAKAGAVGSGQVRGGGHIFSGAVVWYERGRESATDTYLRIYANNFDEAMNLSFVNTVLPAGHTQKDVVKACVDAMAEEKTGGGLKVSLGQVTDLGDAKSPRARTLYGMPRDVLRDVAQTAGAHCNIDDAGKVNIVKEDDPAPNPVITLNSTNGMIGIPHQNLDGGIQVTSLLNPALKPGGLVKINEADITRKIAAGGGGFDNLPMGMADEVKAVKLSEFMIAADGQYMIWSVNHHGDTRGNPWYSELMTRPAIPARAKLG